MSETIHAQGMVETSEDKHSSLDRAISDIQNVLDQINSINRRINGEDSPPVNEPKNPHTTTLLEVLNGGYRRINEKLNEIHEALNNLEGSLF